MYTSLLRGFAARSSDVINCDHVLGMSSFATGTELRQGMVACRLVNACGPGLAKYGVKSMFMSFEKSLKINDNHYLFYYQHVYHPIEVVSAKLTLR